MGLITHGIPSEITVELARFSDSPVFIETGTNVGQTTRWAAKHFKSVFTIERSEELFQRYSGELLALGNVEPLLGDSRKVLPDILAKLDGRPAVFWLDGHWSGGNTAGEQDECPLMDELKLIAHRTGDVVLIDDARLFLSPPPKPHNPDHWPTISEIVLALNSGANRPYMQITNDVVFSVPNQEPFKGVLREYSQKCSDILLRNSAGFSAKKGQERGLVGKLLRAAGLKP